MPRADQRSVGSRDWGQSGSDTLRMVGFGRFYRKHLPGDWGGEAIRHAEGDGVQPVSQRAFWNSPEDNNDNVTIGSHIYRGLN